MIAEATHRATLKAQEVRVIPGATIPMRRVGAKVPDPVLALDSVDKAAFLQCRQRAVQRNPIDFLHPGCGGDPLMAEGTPSGTQQVQDRLPRRCAPQTGVS